MYEIEKARRALAAHRPVARAAPARAAVAMVLRPAAGGASEVLLIERAEKPGDPWSGHMAFPGGRLDPSDPDPRFTAERETFEEVGPRSARRPSCSASSTISKGVTRAGPPAS